VKRLQNAVVVPDRDGVNGVGFAQIDLHPLGAFLEFDNVFVECLWWSVKYEEVYLRAYDSVGHARTSFGRYLEFYNCKRPHSSLDARTPDRAYFDGSRPLARAA